MLTKQKSRKSQRGAAALEFALVAPVLILLVFGIVDFGNVLTAQSIIANASREGARTGSLGGTESAVRTSVTNAISALPNATNPGNRTDIVCETVSNTACLLDDATADSGGTVTVTITYVHSWLSPIPLNFNNTITMTQKSRMRIE